MPHRMLPVIVGLVATMAHADDAPPPVVEVRVSATQARDTTSLTRAAVARTITSRYLAGVRRCYLTLLQRVPEASGAAKLRFTVTAVGRTSEPAVTSFDRALSRCVNGQLKRWRFAIPRSNYAEPTTARFVVSVTFAIAPDPPAPE